MSGYENFNFPEFHAWTIQLRAAGFDVFSPAEQGWGDGTPEDGTLGEDEYLGFLREDVRQVASADVVAVLDGWERSRGARLEVDVAHQLKIPVMRVFDVLSLEGKEIPAVGLIEKTETVLQEADRLVSTDRQSAYGHPLDDFSKTAALWSVILGIPVTAEQVPLCMIAVKLSREVNAHKRDNLVDISGYAKTLDMVVAERARRAS